MFTAALTVAAFFAVVFLVLKFIFGPKTYYRPEDRTVLTGRFRLINSAGRVISRLVHAIILIMVVQWLAIGYVPTLGTGYGPPVLWTSWVVPEIWFLLNCLMAGVTLISLAIGLINILRWLPTNKWTSESNDMWKNEVLEVFTFATIATLIHASFVTCWYLLLMLLGLLNAVFRVLVIFT